MATILLVDDNTMNLQVLGSVLHENGYKVALAKNGPTALSMVEKLSPDLIILDVMMPGMDGFEVCAKLKADEITAEIPVVFVTAKTEVDEIVKGFTLGGVDYITKPFNREELLVRIKTHIDLRESKAMVEKQAAELQEANALKDKVFGVIAHDLRGALGSFREFANMMTDSRIQLSKEELGEFFVALKEQADTTFELLENLLWWSRCQRKVIKPSPEKFDVRECIAKVTENMSYLLDKKQITVNNNINPGIFVVADQQLISIVVKNLVHNALKFSNNSGTIDIDAVSKDDLAEISITDHGVGIDSDDLPKLFDPNQHLANYGTDGEKGSGLGLQVCKELLEYSKGTIFATSEKGKGSTFTFALYTELI